jgi:hypothetical protein
MKQKITLTPLQNEKTLFYVNQLNAIDNMRNEFIQFIVDAHGFKIDPKGEWNVNNSVLEVDVVPQIELVK